MKRKNLLSVVKYIMLAIFVFLSSVVISILTRLILVTDVLPWSFSDNQISSFTGMIEGFVASVAAGIVFYQLKIGNDAEKKQNNIDEARFVLQYNQSFIQDENMCEIERLLEDAMLEKAILPIIRDENRQKFINYLVYLEGLAPLLNTKVLTFERIDDLFAYRFFLAVNNREVQSDQLFEFPDYYRGCFKLYEDWKNYRNSKGLAILQSETSLDKWEHYNAYCNKDILVRPMSDNDNKKDISALIYQTDPYIYPALFGKKISNAKKKLPIMMAQSCVFNSANIRVAEMKGKIVGVAVVLECKPKKKIDTSLVCGESGKHVCEHYFDEIGKYFKEKDETYILCLCVDADTREKKVGEILLKSVIKTSNSKKQKLHVLADNEAAIKLYEKHGFVISDSNPSKGYAYKTEAPLCYEMIRNLTKIY